MRAFNYSMYTCIPYIAALATFVTFYYHGNDNISVALVAGTISVFFAIRMEVTYLFVSAIQAFAEGKASCERIQVIEVFLNKFFFFSHPVMFDLTTV